jgi:2-polyprenyl-3-methyl-5-hydroxy-6-metoxy-1,4-benzoquinol methylase
MPSFTIGESYDWGCLDFVDVFESGLARVGGWSHPGKMIDSLSISADGRAMKEIWEYKVFRPDLAMHRGPEYMLGFVKEFVPEPYEKGTIQAFQLMVAGQKAFDLNGPLEIVHPERAELFAEDTVLTREDIYSYGPPMDTFSEYLALIAMHRLGASILDFGCGNGALLRELRKRGKDVTGIELDRPELVTRIKPDVQPFIKLYDGVFPIPFENEQFEDAVCTEVLEHILDYRGALAEIKRVVRSQAVFTVPDMSVIPMLNPHLVVPWHLLESTHFNFFTLHSLKKLLSEYFSEVEILKVHGFAVNGTTCMQNLMAVCRK